MADKPVPQAQSRRAQTSAIEVVRELFDKSKDQLAAALPRHLTPDRMIRLALTTLRKSPELLGCDPMSILACVVSASQLGLEIDPVLGHAYLVPFNNRKTNRKECQLIVGYKGYLALSRRSGEVAHFSAHVVYKNDAFSFAYGTNDHLAHQPTLDDPGDPIAVYAVIRLKDGGHDFEVLSWKKILEHQAKYAKRGRDGRMFGPWVDDLAAMACKTAIRVLSKRAPLSPEFMRAANLDEMAESQSPQLLDVFAAPVTRTQGVAAQLQARAQSQGQPSTPLPREETCSEEVRKKIEACMSILDEGEVHAVYSDVGFIYSENLTKAQGEELLRALEHAVDPVAAEERHAIENPPES